MRALTIRQPWATLIALGVKTIETRSWRAPQALIGQTIAIHAGKHRPKDVWCSFMNDPVFPPELAALYDYGKCVDPQESNDGEWWRYRWAGPLGVIVATATLADCVEMVDRRTIGTIAPFGDDSLSINPATNVLMYRPKVGHMVNVTDQLPYGDFQPGRWAWMLADVRPCNPLPAKGKQGLWTWQP